MNHVEDGVAFGVPEEAVTDALPSQLACHDLKQVHLDGLLHEHHVVLSHGCGGSRSFSKTSVLKPSCSSLSGLTADMPTKAVVVGWFGFIRRWNRAQHRGSLQGFFLRSLGRWHTDDVVVRACLQKNIVRHTERLWRVAEIPLEV